MMKSFALPLLIGLAFMAGQTAVARADQGVGGAKAGAAKVRGTPVAAPEVVRLKLHPRRDSISTFFGNVDHVANGVGLRNTGHGTIRLRGVERGDAVYAILYFAFICGSGTNATPCPATLTVSFTSKSLAKTGALTGILIGTATQPCWCGTTYGAYAASVPIGGASGLIEPGINDDYEIDGVPSSVTDGSDPWTTNPCTTGGAGLPLAEGASLVVVYQDPSLPVGVVYINDGAVETSGTVDIINPVSPPLLGSARKLTIIGGDGQVGISSTLANPGTAGEKTLVGPTSASLTQIAGPGTTFANGNPDSDWNGDDGIPLNQLWDTHTHSFSAGSVLPAGLSSYDVEYQTFGDCIVWQAHVLTASLP